MIDFDALNIKTKKDATTLLALFSDVVNKSYTIKTTVDALLGEIFPHERKEALISQAQTLHFDLSDQKQLSAFYEELQDAVKKLPVVTLHIAFEPSDGFIKQLCDWFGTSQNYPLLDFVTDKSLLGGVIIEKNGSYKDYSLKKHLKDAGKPLQI